MAAHENLKRRIARFCAWYRLERSCRLVQILAFAIACALALWIAVDKLVYLGLDYSLVGLSLACAGLAGVLVYYLAAPRRPRYVGYLVDRAAGLKNLVVSALEVADREDDLARAVVTRAEAVAGARSPRQVMPLKVNRWGRWLPAPLVLAGALTFIAPLDLGGRRARHELARQEAEKVREGARRLAEVTGRLTEKASKLDSIKSKEITADLKALNEALKDLDQKEALARIGELENKYEDDLNRSRQFQQALDKMTEGIADRELAEESRQTMRNFMKHLRSGNYEKAAGEMKEMARQFGDRNLTTDEKKALAKSLQQMAEELGDKETSRQLADALDKMQSNSLDQQALDKACSACQNGANAMADQLNDLDSLERMKDGLNAAKEGMLGDQFKDFDSQDVEQYLRDTAPQPSLGQQKECDGQCPGGQCQGDGGQCPGGNKPGNGQGGTGGVGQGMGGIPPEAAGPTDFVDEKSPDKVQQGKVLYELFVYGVPEKGEAYTEYTNAARAARQEAAGSLANNRVPRRHEDTVRNYFDSLDAPAPE